MLGQTINHYKITAKLGEGGMGAVYRATDTRLGREVALKILPERLGRFQREAEVLASLNHPHINIVHGLEESDGLRALVLELVEGPTLAERIAEGPIPVEEALRQALEITQALEAPHEKGIIHRDLKPSNVKITPEGGVKVLDFGLAKALETEVSERELANSPTLLEATQDGMVLGTAAYMSPEQARGKVVDKRTDIWSFGLVLFEMLTGRGMFAGNSLTATMAAVIHQEPPLDQLPKDTPGKIQRLLKRCLRKDRGMRLRDMGEARIAIQECLADRPATLEKEPLAPPPQPLWRRLGPWAAVPLLGVLAWSFRPDPPAPEKPVIRFELPVEKDQVLYHFGRQGLAFSPDGTHLAFVSAKDEMSNRTNIRFLDRWESTLPLDEKTWQPFFSPNGKWLGFYWGPGNIRRRLEWQLKKIPVGGGEATKICDCPYSFGASWGAGNTIVYACEGDSGLWQVSALGGEPKKLTELAKEAGERSHRLPHILPDGKTVLFTVVRFELSRVNWSQAQIVAYSLETGKRKLLITGGSDGRYVPTGHLVFMREAILWAAPFDLPSLTMTGKAIPILEGVSHGIHFPRDRFESGAGHFTFSETGSLAYIAGSTYPKGKNRLVWVDRQGKVEVISEVGQYWSPRLSPDGSRIAFRSEDIWTYELVRHTQSPQTFVGGLHYNPIWTPDGTAVVFSSDREGPRNLFWKLIDTGGEAKRLYPSQQRQDPGSWHPDGIRLAFVQENPKKGSLENVETWWGFSGGDIWVLSLEDSPSVEFFVEGTHPEFSPDGRWLTYVSYESGRSEVYVQPYPGPGRKTRISTSGGTAPVWTKGESELIYRSRLGGMMAVEIDIEGHNLIPDKPVELFKGGGIPMGLIRSYDVTPDGERFLTSHGVASRGKEYYSAKKVKVVLNWFEELKRLVPTDN